MTPDHGPAPANAITRDPVRLVWVGYGLVQSVVIVLVTTNVLTHLVSTVVTSIALALYVAVSELFVRRETVPLHPRKHR